MSIPKQHRNFGYYISCIQVAKHKYYDFAKEVELMKCYNRRLIVKLCLFALVLGMQFVFSGCLGGLNSPHPVPMHQNLQNIAKIELIWTSSGGEYPIRTVFLTLSVRISTTISLHQEKRFKMMGGII